MKIKNLSFQFVALSLAISLLFQSVLVPIAEANYLTPKPSPSVPDSPFVLPNSIGETVNTYAPHQSSRLIYHIQDIHGHVPAQINISEIVNQLSITSQQQNKKLVVAIEGTVGKIDLDSLTRHPKEKKIKVGSALLRAGYLYGEEYAALIHNPGEIQLEGVEQASLFEKNDQAETETVEARKEIFSIIRDIKNQLNQLKPHNYNERLARLEANRVGFEKGDISFLDHLTFMIQLNPTILSSHPNLKAAYSISLKEKAVDYEVLEKESKQLLKDVLNAVDEADIKKITDASLAMKSGHLSSASYYSDLLNRTSKEYPHVQSYVDYVQAIETLNADQLFDDVEEVEVELAKALVSHPIVGELYSHLRWIERQEKFLSLELIPSEWKKNKNTTIQTYLTRHENIRQFINDQKTDIGYQFNVPSFPEDVLKQAVQGSYSYYKAASDRDRAMINNLETVLEQYAEQEYNVALIAGGFHTPGLEKELKTRGLAFQTLRPHLEPGIELDQTHQLDAFNYYAPKISNQFNLRNPAPTSVAAPEMASALSASVLSQETSKRLASALNEQGKRKEGKGGSKGAGKGSRVLAIATVLLGNTLVQNGFQVESNVVLVLNLIALLMGVSALAVFTFKKIIANPVVPSPVRNLFTRGGRIYVSHDIGGTHVYGYDGLKKGTLPGITGVKNGFLSDKKVKVTLNGKALLIETYSSQHDVQVVLSQTHIFDENSRIVGLDAGPTMGGLPTLSLVDQDGILYRVTMMEKGLRLIQKITPSLKLNKIHAVAFGRNSYGLQNGDGTIYLFDFNGRRIGEPLAAKKVGFYFDQGLNRYLYAAPGPDAADISITPVTIDSITEAGDDVKLHVSLNEEPKKLTAFVRVPGQGFVLGFDSGDVIVTNSAGRLSGEASGQGAITVMALRDDEQAVVIGRDNGEVQQLLMARSHIGALKVQKEIELGGPISSAIFLDQKRFAIGFETIAAVQIRAIASGDVINNFFPEQSKLMKGPLEKRGIQLQGLTSDKTREIVIDYKTGDIHHKALLTHQKTAHSGNGRYMAVQSETFVEIFDNSKVEETREIQVRTGVPDPFLSGLALNHSGNHVAYQIGNKPVHSVQFKRDPKTKEETPIETKYNLPQSADIRLVGGLHFSTLGHRLVAILSDRVLVYNTGDPRIQHDIEIPHGGSDVTAGAIRPNGHEVAVGLENGTVMWVDLTEERKDFYFREGRHMSRILEIDMNHPTQILTTSETKVVHWGHADNYGTRFQITLGVLSLVSGWGLSWLNHAMANQAGLGVILSGLLFLLTALITSAKQGGSNNEKPDNAFLAQFARTLVGWFGLNLSLTSDANVIGQADGNGTDIRINSFLLKASDPIQFLGNLIALPMVVLHEVGHQVLRAVHPRLAESEFGASVLGVLLTLLAAPFILVVAIFGHLLTKNRVAQLSLATTGHSFASRSLSNLISPKADEDQTVGRLKPTVQRLVSNAQINRSPKVMMIDVDSVIQKQDSFTPHQLSEVVNSAVAYYRNTHPDDEEVSESHLVFQSQMGWVREFLKDRAGQVEGTSLFISMADADGLSQAVPAQVMDLAQESGNVFHIGNNIQSPVGMTSVQVQHPLDMAIAMGVYARFMEPASVHEAIVRAIVAHLGIRMEQYEDLESSVMSTLMSLLAA